jgi:integrase
MSKVRHLRAVRTRTPTTVNGKVAPPTRVRNSDRRTREHLTPPEVEKLMAAAGHLGRHGHRDATLILLAYRHGLRVSELVALRSEQIDLKLGLLHVTRLKNGTASTHTAQGQSVTRDEVPHVVGSGYLIGRRYG